MKIRYRTRCAFCRRSMEVGSFAVRAFNGHWHQDCYRGYRDQRDRIKKTSDNPDSKR